MKLFRFQEVDLMLNDASKTTTAMGWHKDTNLIKRVEVGRRHTRRCLLMSLALAKTQEEEVCETLFLMPRV